MKNPPHPGKVVRVSCLEPLGLNVTEGAYGCHYFSVILNHYFKLSCNFEPLLQIYTPTRGNFV